MCLTTDSDKMMLETLLRYAREEVFEPSDEIVDSWPISNNPWLVLGIIATYIVFVTRVGPRWMRHRKPYQLKGLILAYNFVQVIICGVLVISPFLNPRLTTSIFALGCRKCLVEGSEDYYTCRGYYWYYFLLKLFDLCDTVFMVLRRKENQVTFLHVYHHVSITLMSFMFLRWTFGEHLTLSGLLNNLVHVVMYFYYFLAGLGPEMQRRLWWKRYITRLQIAQFVIAMGGMVINLLLRCHGNKFAAYLGLLYGAYFIYLFVQFYVKSYRKNKKVN